MPHDENPFCAASDQATHLPSGQGCCVPPRILLGGAGLRGALPSGLAEGFGRRSTVTNVVGNAHAMPSISPEGASHGLSSLVCLSLHGQKLSILALFTGHAQDSANPESTGSIEPIGFSDFSLDRPLTL